MKYSLRYLTGLTISLFLFAIFPQTANAAFQGCPESWSAPSESWKKGTTGIPTELEEVKSQMGFNLVITQNLNEVSKDGSTWYQVPGVGAEISTWLALSGGVGRYSYTIQMAGCQNVVQRFYKYPLPTLKLDENVIDVQNYFADATNRSYFGGPSDFTKVNTISPALSICILGLQAQAKASWDPGGTSWGYWNSSLWSTPPVSTCENLANLLPKIRLFFQDTKCLHFDRTYMTIQAGEECTLVLGTYYYPSFSLSEAKAISLATFTLTGPDTKEQIAQTKAAAELKAKLEAEAKAAAELKAKQETEVKAALELKAKQEADAKVAAELKAKQDADAKVAADKLVAEKLAAAKLASLKKTTITCVKGKLTKKVTAVKPVCPAGYKKK